MLKASIPFVIGVAHFRSIISFADESHSSKFVFILWNKDKKTGKELEGGGTENCPAPPLKTTEYVLST